MMPELQFANAEVITADAVFRGGVTVADGRIVAISDGGAVPPGAIDLGGDYLGPGLVEIHTDNVEKQMVPRPGVIWPAPLAAMLSHDAQMTAAGVTTVYDALSVGEYRDKAYRRDLLDSVMSSVALARAENLFRADHRVHLRCEIADVSVIELFRPYADDANVGMISVMDHTPGQRQWRDLKSFKTFQNSNLSDAEFEAYVAERIAASNTNTTAVRRTVLDLWGGRGPVASHDDTTEAHVAEAIADGIAISEFPTTMLAAEAAKAAGMTTVMGAPNVVRGGSHSGNVSALELASAGLLDALSSDYAPISLVHAVFALEAKAGLTLPQAMATVSANPAAMLGLTDRGAIAVGLRADLVQMRKADDCAFVRRAWVEGERVS